jgi:hypothetical protein
MMSRHICHSDCSAGQQTMQCLPLLRFAMTRVCLFQFNVFNLYSYYILKRSSKWLPSACSHTSHVKISVLIAVQILPVKLKIPYSEFLLSVVFMSRITTVQFIFHMLHKVESTAWVQIRRTRRPQSCAYDSVTQKHPLNNEWSYGTSDWQQRQAASADSTGRHQRLTKAASISG